MNGNMNINLLPFVIVWVLLAIAVIVLIFRHRKIAGQADEHLDVLEAASVAQQQMALGQQLAAVDKWGKTLTVITVVYGLILAAFYVYQSWEQMSRTGM